MKNWTNEIVLSLALFLCLVLDGCGGNEKSSIAVGQNEVIPCFELAPRVHGITIYEPKKISSLGPSNVLVSVNGAPLTRQMFDDIIAIRVEGLKAENLTAYEINKKAEVFAKNYLRNYVAQRLLVDDAFANNCVTTNEVADHVTTLVADLAEKKGVDIESYKSTYGDKFRYVEYEMAISYVLDQVVAKKIPPTLDVTDEFVAVVQHKIALDNAAATATNMNNRIILQSVKDDICAGKNTFDNAVTQYQLPSDVDEIVPGYYGQFMKDEIENVHMAGQIFSLQEGEISDVLEDDEYIQVIKVIRVHPAETNATGDVISSETRELARFGVEKMPLSIEEKAAELKKELQRQMQVQGINSYLTNLYTNGLNDIVYPYGKNLL